MPAAVTLVVWPQDIYPAKDTKSRMPLFQNSTTGQYVLVSYKCMYSLFSRSENWRFIAFNVSPRLLARILNEGQYPYLTQVVRNPYDRIVSCFKDKFRANTVNFTRSGFELQQCQKLLLPYLGLNDGSEIGEIAERFLEFKFKEFLQILPEVYCKDVHYQPQVWTHRLVYRTYLSIPLPCVKVIQMEDYTQLSLIKGLDYATKVHSTGHIDENFNLNSEDYSYIYKLYRSDFTFGKYEKHP